MEVSEGFKQDVFVALAGRDDIVLMGHGHNKAGHAAGVGAVAIYFFHFRGDRFRVAYMSFGAAVRAINFHLLNLPRTLMNSIQ